MPKTVLVVDDQPSLRRMVRFALQFQGVNVLEAEDGVAALALLQDHTVDLMITDWKMPNMNGLELIRRVRRQADLMHLPIIMVSCEMDPAARREARAEGTLTWLQKPFRMQEIQSAVALGLSVAPPTQPALPGVEHRL